MKLNLFLLLRKQLNFSYILIYLLICAFLLESLESVPHNLSDYQSILCADLHCREPISDGITTNLYPALDAVFLSFKKDTNIRILAKTSDKIFYFAEVNKKRGFVPAYLIKETNIHFEETKLRDVKFDFQEYKKTLVNSKSDSGSKSRSNRSKEKQNDPVLLRSSNDQSIPDDSQSNTATPFVYSQKTIIDGTTIDKELLAVTATPSPTFIGNPVTKTATVEANFTDINELDKKTVGQEENELGKKHGSLSKQLVKPIVQIENDDVIIEGEYSSVEQEEVSLETNQTQKNVIDKKNLNNNSDNIVSIDESGNVSTHQNITATSDVASQKFVQISNNKEEIVAKVLQPTLEKTSKRETEDILTNESPVNSDVVDNQIQSDSPQIDDGSLLESDGDAIISNDDGNTNKDFKKEEKLPDQRNHKDDTINVNNDKVAPNADMANVSLIIQQNDTNEKSTVKNVDSEVLIIPSNESQSPKVKDNIKNINNPTTTNAYQSSIPSPHIPNQPQNPSSSSSTVQHQHQIYLLNDPNHQNIHNQHQYHNQPPADHPSSQLFDNPNPNVPKKQVPSSDFLEPKDEALYKSSDSVVNNQQQQHSHHINSQLPLHLRSKLNLQQQELQNNNPTSVDSDIDSIHTHHHHLGYSHPNPNQAVDQNSLPNNNNSGDYLNSPSQFVDSNSLQHNNSINGHLYPNQGADPNSPLNSDNYVHPHHKNNPQPNIQYQQLNVHESDLNSPPQQILTENTKQLRTNSFASNVQQATVLPVVDSVHNLPSSIPESSLVDPLLQQQQQQQYTVVANNNIIKRKLLAERVGFVSVIMEVIPDEVELFFESFNVSLHAIIFTSIVAFFWCFMKVFIFFISSSKKVRELQDIICQTKRKLYYFEAEKDKIKEEYSVCLNESSSYKDNLNKIEKRKYQLEQENEKLKNELIILKKDNASLKSQAESNPEINLKLNSVFSELEAFKQENHELVSKIDELEEQIDSQSSTIKDYENKSKSDKEMIDNLNQKLYSLNEEIETLNKTIKESEQKFIIVQLDNTNLKEIQSKLNEEIREIKDELLSSQEKVKHLENEYKTLEWQLKSANQKSSTLSEELESKNAEIISMQTLLNKLNKNISKEHNRQRSMDLNGDITDSVNGDDRITVDPDVDDDETNNAEDSLCLQDIVQLQLRLTQLEFEKERFKQKYEAIQNQMDETVGDIESIKKLNEQLKQEIETASQERMKAIMELEVLTKYYKEKEIEYAKDIGVHKIKQEQQSEDVESLNSKLEVIQEENAILKDQLKSVKKELEETERRYKSQLNQLEKQSHENWIAARSAERKYEETKAEASALRQTLSQSVKSPPPMELSFGGYLDDTASSVSSLPEVLNNSLSVLPPPPPPPFPFPSIFAPPPIPPAVVPQQSPPSTIFDSSNEPSSTSITNTNSYWAAPSIVPVVTVQAPTSISSNTSNYTYDTPRSMPPVVSTDMTITYSQTNPTGTILHQQQQQYGSTPNINSQMHQPIPSNNQQHTYGHHYGHHQLSSSFHSSQLDLTRNTYSSMSQCSTNIPITTTTNPSMVPPLVGYDMQRATPANQQYSSQQPQQQQQPNYYASLLQPQSNSDSRLSNNSNPFSMSHHHSNYSTGYSQHQSHDVYLNANQGHHGQMFNISEARHQEQPVIDPNNPHYPTKTSYPQSHSIIDQSSQSRPQSVHNQMV